jgi:hypothetical protein
MTDLAPVSIANSQGYPDDDSVFRSGGQKYQYSPRPRIATARPRAAEERRASERPQPPPPPEQSAPSERSST